MINKINKPLVNHEKKKAQIHNIRNEKGKITIEREEIVTNHETIVKIEGLTKPISTEETEKVIKKQQRNTGLDSITEGFHQISKPWIILMRHKCFQSLKIKDTFKFLLNINAKT